MEQLEKSSMHARRLDLCTITFFYFFHHFSPSYAFALTAQQKLSQPAFAAESGT